jgi:hypothetical protein
MAETNAAPVKAVHAYPKRCTEKVIRAEIRSELPVQVVGVKKILEVGKSDGSNRKVEAMALHPWGLYAFIGGRRLVIPNAMISYAEITDDET